ncbi:MAG TPA: DinB family protein [Candidatus Limnocylindrales bacterium]|nr:DinB family protein [Candidatus Limnocylindrales bacterium]
MNELAGRLRDAGSEMLALRGPLVAGEPWPLSAAYGTEPEADWGPREVLAHVNEMLPYWATELRRIVAGDPAAATPFGRISTDPARLGRIAADRELAVGDLLDRIAAGLATVEDTLAGLMPADLERRGVHTARGEMTVDGAADRFLVSHLAEHVEQLRAILARGPATA